METLLNNRYQVIRTLGGGGFGETFLALDTQMPSKRRCVIKQLRPIQNNLQIYQLVQERFEREAAILEELGGTTDQIPALYAYFQSKGQFYLVQEWIEGKTLTAKVQHQGLFSESAVREILVNLLPVLEYVHTKGIIHRDIKPDNIILRAGDEKPVLIDFGAVRETMGTVVNSQGNPTSSIVIGTPGYMSNEQAAGRPVYSSDLFSLGITAIYLLTGKQPQELETDQGTGEIIWHRQGSNVSPTLTAVIERVIAYHPRERFTTAREMLSSLQLGAVTFPATVPYSQAPVRNTPPQVIPQNPMTASTVLSNQADNPGNGHRKILLGSLIVGGLIGGSIVIGSVLNKAPQRVVEQPVVQASDSVNQPAINDKESQDAIPSVKSPSPTQEAADLFGAIFYSSSTRVYGSVTGSSRAEAERVALEDCQQQSSANDCSVPVWFKNAWGALAVGSNGAYGTGWGADPRNPSAGKDIAEQYALQTCQKYGGVNCRVIVSTEAR